MSKLSKLFVLAAVAACSVQSDAAVDDSKWRGGPSEAWFVNWDKALAESKKTRKPMFLLNTGSDWCGWCKRLKADVLDTPEFKEFASKELVLVYLDSPMRDPLGKDQKAHNKLIAESLPFGGGVPNVLVMNFKGEKLGNIGGGGQKAEAYIERLRKVLSSNGERVNAKDARRLFEDGYEKTAEAIAAWRASLPPVKKDDFKAVLTGVAVVDNKMRFKPNKAEFLAPETELEVPYGKTALFRVEYDFPEGYGARVWVRDGKCSDGKVNSRYFGSNPSGIYKGKGTAYGFLSLLDRGKDCTVEFAVIKTNSDPELDGLERGWTIGEFPVKITFREKSGDAEEGEQDADAPAVSKSVPEGWTEDFEAAKAKASKEGKFILMNFSGSDWCGWCVKMDKEVFSQKRFVREASKKYVLVMVDSPRDKSVLSKLARRQNDELKSKYDVKGFPTVVIVAPDGEEVKRSSGYQKGGPNGYVKFLKKLMRGVKWPKKAK